MESEYFYTMSIFISSHMYTTDPFSCELMCSLTKYVSDTKCAYCTVLSNKQGKQNTTCLLLQQTETIISFLCEFVL
jgi:hypothetical protein